MTTKAYRCSLLQHALVLLINLFQHRKINADSRRRETSFMPLLPTRLVVILSTLVKEIVCWLEACRYVCFSPIRPLVKCPHQLQMKLSIQVQSSLVSTHCRGIDSPEDYCSLRSAGTPGKYKVKQRTKAKGRDGTVVRIEGADEPK